MVKNKITITDESIDIKDKTCASVSNDLIKNLSLDILNDSDLEFEYNIKESIKINIIINIKENVKCQIVDKKRGASFKVKYNYNVGQNSSLTINTLNDVQNIREHSTTNLNGENSSIKYILKTVCTQKENYDIIINHNYKNTSSLLMTNGLNIENGSLFINATGYIPKKASDATLVQDNRIINLTDNTCNINPVLLIDEVNVSASHSAHISAFNPDDLFYLESRGIPEKEATKLLIKDFLSSKLDLVDKSYIEEICEKYWR